MPEGSMSSILFIFKSVGRKAISASFILRTILTPLVPVGTSPNIVSKNTSRSLERALDSSPVELAQPNLPHDEGSDSPSIQPGAEGPFHIQAAVLRDDLVLAEAQLTLASVLGFSSLQVIRSHGSQLKALDGRV